MSKRNAKRSFHQEQVLNQWMMVFFKCGTLQALKIRQIEPEFLSRMFAGEEG